MSIVSDVLGGLTGSTAADASIQAANIQQAGTAQAIQAQQAASAQGQGFLSPFEQIGQQGLDQASFLTDPQAQFDFLQNNPLFQASLDNANTQTQNMAASQGRLSAGDTLQQLSQNVLLSAAPLVSQQSQNISNLLGSGQNLATTQANTAIGQGTNIGNLLTSGAAAQAAGVVGAANAQAQGAQNLLGLGGTLGGAAILSSDDRLKSNITKIGEENGLNIYTWTWNDIAKALFGLSGLSYGVIAQEVQKVMPEAITKDRGFFRVNYKMIGDAVAS